jgi:hypothetical protein
VAVVEGAGLLVLPVLNRVRMVVLVVALVLVAPHLERREQETLHL